MSNESKRKINIASLNLGDSLLAKEFAKQVSDEEVAAFNVSKAIAKKFADDRKNAKDYQKSLQTNNPLSSVKTRNKKGMNEVGRVHQASLPEQSTNFNSDGEPIGVEN